MIEATLVVVLCGALGAMAWCRRPRSAVRGSAASGTVSVGGRSARTDLLVGVMARVRTGDRERHAFRNALPGCLEDVARSLRSGSSVSQAMADAAAAGDDLARRSMRVPAIVMNRGAPADLALADWAARSPVSDVGLAVAALSLGMEAGGSRARAVDLVASTLRERLAMAEEVRAQSASARASAVVLMVAPVAFAVVASIVDPAVGVFLLTTPVGGVCMVAALALDAAGVWWISRIVRSDG